MGIHRRSRSHRRRVLAGDVKYLLRATFDGEDQAFSDGVVLNTVAQGIQDGQLTPVIKDGTLAIVDGKCAFTAQTVAPGWGRLGLYGGRESDGTVPRALGRGFLGTVNLDATNRDVYWVVGWLTAANLAAASREYTCRFYWDASIQFLYQATGRVVASYSASTDYQLAIVLGGADVNGVPWYQGQTPASYLYGASLYIKGGAFPVWTKLWQTALGNTATLYAAFSNYDANGTIVLPKGAPDVDLSAVLQPTCLSTFTGANGTSLDAITPEVGGGWTEHSPGDWEIQSNKATPDTVARQATVDSGISDGLIDVTINIGGDDANHRGIVARLTDADNCWLLQPRPNVDAFYIKEIVAGVPTTRATVGVTIDPSIDYDLRLICDGQQLDGFLDAGNKASYGSASFQETATEHGISAGALGDTFDNYHVAARTSSVYDQQFDRL